MYLTVTVVLNFGPIEKKIDYPCYTRFSINSCIILYNNIGCAIPCAWALCYFWSFYLYKFITYCTHNTLFMPNYSARCRMTMQFTEDDHYHTLPYLNYTYQLSCWQDTARFNNPKNLSLWKYNIKSVNPIHIPCMNQTIINIWVSVIFTPRLPMQKL